MTQRTPPLGAESGRKTPTAPFVLSPVYESDSLYSMGGRLCIAPRWYTSRPGFLGTFAIGILNLITGLSRASL